jgi:hypothetical protein
MYELYLKIPELPTSTNVKLRSHRMANHQENKRWDLMIHYETVGKKPPAPLERAQVAFVRHSDRMLDFDGVVGSLKPVMDALVEARIVKDDNWSIVGAWTVDQVFRPKKDGPLLEIRVMEL